MNEVSPSYAHKLSPTSLTKANLWKLDADVPNDADYDIWLPLASVHEVSDRMKIYFMVTLLVKGLLFQSWNVSLRKNVSCSHLGEVLHDVPMVAYTSDGLSLIASKIGTPMMLDSYTSSMCLESRGRSSYARILIEIDARNDLCDIMVMASFWPSLRSLLSYPTPHHLNDLNNATLHIDGQSTEVDAPLDIIDLDEDDDIIDDEDALPHDLADSDDEDLVNVEDDDGVEVMSADVARGHGGDGGGDDRPPSHHIPTGCGGCFANRGKGTRKANLGGRKAGRLHTRQETRNLGLKKITDDKGPSWADINAGIQQHLQKLYNTNKASLKAAHWVINPETGTYDVETIRQGRPESITLADWDAQIAFWNDPRNQARAAQNRQNRAKSTVVCRQGSRSLARLRDEMMASSETREYPSLIHTFFMTHTVNGVFTRDDDRAIYEEMLRLQALGSNTPSGVPYTDEEINALARKGKQRGHLPGVGRVLPGGATDVLIPAPPPPPQCTHNSGDVKKLKKKNKYLTKQVNLMMKPFRSDEKFSQMLNQYESTPEFDSGSGGCEDDEMADDEDGDEDEEDEEDGNS
ncbi:RNA-directed DNA polymerase, eukaryota [Tanacetum coccineum]